MKEVAIVVGAGAYYGSRWVVKKTVQGMLKTLIAATVSVQFHKSNKSTSDTQVTEIQNPISLFGD